MTALWTLVDSAVAEVLTAHADYLTPKGQERARREIVRKVTSSIRDSVSAPKQKPEDVQPAAKPVTHAELKCWGKEWWALLLQKINARQSTSWMMQYALEAKHGAAFAVQIEEAPSPDDVAKFEAYPSDGYAFANWKPWFDAHNVRLPEWRERMWVFLPSVNPPIAGEVTDAEAREFTDTG